VSLSASKREEIDVEACGGEAERSASYEGTARRPEALSERASGVEMRSTGNVSWTNLTELSYGIGHHKRDGGRKEKATM